MRRICILSNVRQPLVLVAGTTGCCSTSKTLEGPLLDFGTGNAKSPAHFNPASRRDCLPDQGPPQDRCMKRLVGGQLALSEPSGGDDAMLKTPANGVSEG
mgnify:CR=1 FL=1